MNEANVTRLHTQRDEADNARRMKRLWILFLFGTLLCAGAIGASLLWRDATHMNNPNEMKSQLLTMGITLLWGGAFIFLWSMKMTPLRSYRRYLRETQSGLSREVVGTLTSFDEDTTFRDGISFYGMVVNVGDPKNLEDDRLLYWDQRLKKPDVKPGDRVKILAHGNDIIGFLKWQA